MKSQIFTLKIVLGTILLLVSQSFGANLDIVLTCHTHDEAFLYLVKLKNTLDDETLDDLAIALRSIERHTQRQTNIGFSKTDCDKYFVTLINKKTIKDVLSLAATIMLAESNNLPTDQKIPYNSNVSNINHDEREFLTRQRTFGKWMLNKYVINTSESKAEKSKDAE